MNINLTAYRAAIGSFGNSISRLKIKNSHSSSPTFAYLTLTVLCFFLFFPEMLASTLTQCAILEIQSISRTVSKKMLTHSSELTYFSWFLTFSLINKILLIRSGLEENPGPSPPPRFTFGTWNLDSLLARDGCKLAAIEGLDSLNKFDIFGICETYLNDSIDNSDIALSGFSPDPIRADCKESGNRPKGGVCLFYKDHVPLKHRPDLQLIDECIVTEIKIKNKKFFYVLLYRSPSQTREVFLDFTKKLNELLDKLASESPFGIILTGDLNARSPSFWDDEGIETFEGKEISDLTVLNGLEQVINEPTHFPRDGISTCIDHIFTNQRNVIIDSGVIPSPDPFCKHFIIYGKINMSLPSPPPYKRKIWEYHNANQNGIYTSLSSIDWEIIFNNKSPNQMVNLFQAKLLEIMESQVPNKIITVDSKHAPWVTPEVMTALRKNKCVYKKWVKRGKIPSDKIIVNQTQHETNKIIIDAKKTYTNELGRKVCDLNSGSKCFWTAFNTLLNKKR